jgi:hypothetical protein
MFSIYSAMSIVRISLENRNSSLFNVVATVELIRSTCSPCDNVDVDPGVGPVDDAGCHVQIASNTKLDDLVFDGNNNDDDDECDSSQRFHLPTMSDMLIAFPSQKGHRQRSIVSFLHVSSFCFLCSSLVQVLRPFESHTSAAGT